MLKPIKELLFPVHCFGCGVLGIEICSVCRRYWNPHFYIQNIEGMQIYSAIRYSPIAKAVVINAKENSIKIADELIINALHICLKRLPTSVLRRAILIPVPGSRRAIRKRGRDFILEITNELSLRSGIPVVTGMKIKRNLLDQSRLSAVDRKRNIHGNFAFSYAAGFSEIKGELILVDDLVTTGATLLEARRALQEQGLVVNRAITACMAQSLNIGG